MTNVKNKNPVKAKLQTWQCGLVILLHSGSNLCCKCQHIKTFKTGSRSEWFTAQFTSFRL